MPLVLINLMTYIIHPMAHLSDSGGGGGASPSGGMAQNMTLKCLPTLRYIDITIDYALIATFFLSQQ